jgi:hypothetical protein
VDIEIQAKEIMYHKANLNRIMAECTGQPIEKARLLCLPSLCLCMPAGEAVADKPETLLEKCIAMRCILVQPWRAC